MDKKTSQVAELLTSADHFGYLGGYSVVAVVAMPKSGNVYDILLVVDRSPQEVVVNFTNAGFGVMSTCVLRSVDAVSVDVLGYIQRYFHKRPMTVEEHPLVVSDESRMSRFTYYLRPPGSAGICRNCAIPKTIKQNTETIQHAY